LAPTYTPTYIILGSYIDLKLAEFRSLEEALQSIFTTKIQSKEEIQIIKEQWPELKSLLEKERTLAKWRDQREQADWARTPTQTFQAKEWQPHRSNFGDIW
jgi:hypothetical protein